MDAEKWSTRKAWFYASYKSLPKDVADAIETLLDERESLGDEDDDN